MKRLTLLAVPVLALLTDCAEAPPPAGPRVYAVDLAGGAKVCTVPEGVAARAGQLTETTMTIGNDGGWCGIILSRPGTGSESSTRTQPFAAGFVEARPAHGVLHIHSVGDKTRVDYIPDRGYAGSDTFTVRLKPGDARLKVAVTVQAGTPVAATPATTRR